MGDDLEQVLAEVWLEGFRSRALLVGDNIPAVAQAVRDAKTAAIGRGLEAIGER